MPARPLPLGGALREAVHAAPAHGHRDVLLAVHHVGRRRRHHAGAGGRFPELLAGPGVVGQQAAVGRALEHQVAGGGERAAVPGRHIVHAPGFLLRHRVPGHEAAEGLALGRLHVGELGQVPAQAGVRAARHVFVELPVLVVHQVDRHMLRRQVGQAGLRVERHRVPVVRAEGAGNGVVGLGAVARGGDADGAAVLVVAGGPVHFGEVLGRDELAVGAVDDEEEAVLGRMQQHLARLAADLHVGQDHRLGGGVVPVVAGRLLVVPLVLAGVGVQRHHRAQVEVVAALGAARLVRPGRAVAGAHVHQVELGVEGEAVPGGAPAAGFPVLAARVPGLRGLGHRGVFEGLARVARHHEPAPFLLARLRVVGGDEAAHAVFGAAVADDDLALEHARRAGDGVAALLAFERVFLPDLLAGGGVQRNQAAVEGGHVDLALVNGHAAVHHVAATLEAL